MTTNYDGYRKGELEQMMLQPGTKSKWFISQCLQYGVVTSDEANKYGVKAGQSYCPECDRLSDENTGCPRHGVWW